MIEKRCEKNTLLQIKNLSISFRQYEQGLRQSDLQVIRDLDVTVHRGEMVAVVGSSGSGKSLLAHAVLGILPYNSSMSGEIRYRGEILDQRRAEQLRGGEIVLVPQSTSYLDPLMKIGSQVRKGRRDRKLREKNDSIFHHYHLKKEVEEQYPFELSGGMTRRVLISTALMEQPKLIIADEPTPGLHIDVAKRALGHFRQLADEGAGVLLITHDLELAAQVADRIVVFYAGTTLEDARAEDFAQEATLKHPYTKALWRAMPKNGFQFIKGIQPYAKDMPKGCPFGPRCSQFTEACADAVPYRKAGDGYVRCIHYQGADRKKQLETGMEREESA